MKSYYDHRTPWHDEYMSYQSREKMEKLHAKIINTITPLIKNLSVLEIACGTGNWTSVLANRASQVTAIDSSRQSLELAQKKNKGIDNISYHRADAFALDKLQGSFDVIFASDFFSHVPNEKIDSFLEMLNKIVKQETTVIFLEMLEIQFFLDEKNYIDSHKNRVSKRELPDGSSYDVIKNFHSEEELRDIFLKYGNNITYIEFDSLKRWMLVYQTR